MRSSNQAFKWHHSLAFRLIALFLAALLPLQLAGIALYTVGITFLQSRIEADAQANLLHLSERFAAEIAVLTSTLSELAENNTLARLAYNANAMTTPDFYLTLSGFQEHLVTLKLNNSLIDELHIYFVQTGKQLQLCSIEQRLYDAFTTFDPGAFAAFEQAARLAGHSSLTYGADSVSLSLLAPSYVYYTGRAPTYALELKLSATELSRFLAGNSARTNRNTAIYSHQAGRVFCVSENGLPPEVFLPVAQALEASGLPREDASFVRDLSLSGEEYFATARYIHALKMTFIQLVPQRDLTGVLDSYRSHLWAFVFASVLGFAACGILALKMIRRPVRGLVQGFRAIEEGRYDAQVDPSGGRTELHYLTLGFNHMAERLNDSINRLYKQELYAKRMELRQLQMQINPHFLYNSYFILHRMIEQGDLEGSKMLSRYLGEYFQYINRNANDQAALKREWAHLSSYVEIQRLRYGRRMEIRLDPLPPGLAEVTVPWLILQPLMENAIEHGLRRKLSGGLARLCVREEGRLIRILVEDNGEDLSDEVLQGLRERLDHSDAPGQDSTALINIHRRLQLFYGPAFGLSLARSGLGGLEVEMRLAAAEKEGC